ncbi:MAG: MoxR family ATPase [Armatimonadetes bacterium]|nr:MoxR family ATPase [Armatimonadota bacterium]MDE2207124.1 MoxR family ATPase [Armatimonadota bacterium]
MDYKDVAEKAGQVVHAVEAAIKGKTSTVEMALAILLSNGHLLIEDIPGVGKTTLAKALARSLGLSFKRIQFTPDMLPSEITGMTFYNQKSGEFEVRRGPVYANIVLADEINRTTPKVQSALLECMEERQVSIEGSSHALPRPFFVIATQNTVDVTGTFALPEAQLDRFSARIRIGYPDRKAEQEILDLNQTTAPAENIESAVPVDELAAMQAAVQAVYVDPDVRSYMLDVVDATRNMDAVALGVSPRGSLHLMHAAQARAAISGRNYVKPDDVKALAVPVLAHRLILRPEGRIRGATQESCVMAALEQQTVPVGAA